MTRAKICWLYNIITNNKNDEQSCAGSLGYACSKQ